METDIAKKIKDIRSELGMTQKELAFLIGSKKANIANYETGRVIPPGNVLLRIMQLEKGKYDEKT